MDYEPMGENKQNIYGKRSASRDPSPRGREAFQSPGKAAVQKILEWLPINPTSFRSHPEYDNEFGEFHFSPKREQVFNAAWEIARNTWQNKTFREIMTTWNKRPGNLLGNGRPNYFAPELSLRIACRLIMEQMVDPHRCIEFVQNVLDVIDKVNPKVNALVIVSPPSAGKTFFIESLLAAVWSRGFVRNQKKFGDQFPYQDAVGCRAIEWNECVLEGDSATETAKQLWEGHNITVNVKYEKGATLTRTPLFVSANSPPWTFVKKEEKAFRDRCFYHLWSRQPWLKELKLQLCPLLWYELITSNWKEIAFWEELDSAQKIIEEVNGPNVQPDRVFFDEYLLAHYPEHTL